MCYANDNADFFSPPRSMSSVLAETLKRSAFYLHCIHGGLLRHATAHSSACKQKNSRSLQRFNICATAHSNICHCYKNNTAVGPFQWPLERPTNNILLLLQGIHQRASKVVYLKKNHAPGSRSSCISQKNPLYDPLQTADTRAAWQELSSGHVFKKMASSISPNASHDAVRQLCASSY